MSGQSENRFSNPLINTNWNYPTQIYYGPNRVNEVQSLCASLNFNKVLIITDQGLKDFDFVTTLHQSLPGSEVFANVKANPNGENISQGVKAYQSGNFNGIVCIGGGSALDAGKAIALMVGQNRSIWDFEDIGDNWSRVDTKNIAPLIAIPTTAGTGSEVGRASVIVDEETDPLQHSKKIIFHPEMLPKHVVLDPMLTTGLPPHITAATGIDAFVHAFEAYCAPGFHPMADGIALKAMSLIKENLPIAFNKGNDLAARGNMLVASSMGATAFQKGLGGVHALAHPLGAIFDKHHGLLNAILLPYVIVANKTAIATRMEELCSVLNLSSLTFDGFLTWVLDFRKELDIPNSLSEIGIELAHPSAKDIGQLAVLDASAAGNPIALSGDQYQTIFENAVNGMLS